MEALSTLKSHRLYFLYYGILFIGGLFLWVALEHSSKFIGRAVILDLLDESNILSKYIYL